MRVHLWRRRASTAVILGLFTVAPAFATGAGASPDTGTDAGSRAARAVIRDATGAFVGTLHLRQVGPTTVLVTARAGRLTAGFHGFHIHGVGICDPTTRDPAGNPAPFLTAGLHFDTAGAGHGNHAGDLPPLLVSGGGTTSAVVQTDRFRVAELFDADGSAIIVHAGADNLANIPARYTSSTTGAPGPDAATLNTGDAGARAACGVVVRGR